TLMYVCLCNSYRESELREVASEGIRCAVEAYFALGSGPCCGRCLEFAQEVIDNACPSTAIASMSEGD
ncbi:MAG TPA: hypothetical protein VKA18_01415, partial [Alphaproteobacteria bacterium]|nr:hypothetical protein [Alphaproteobacteria bacterium]